MLTTFVLVPKIGSFVLPGDPLLGVLEVHFRHILVQMSNCSSDLVDIALVEEGLLLSGTLSGTRKVVQLAEDVVELKV